MTTPEYMDNIKEAQDFADSPRGRYITAQALYYGIQKLSEVQGVLQEKSNISDMSFLLNCLYPGYKELFDHQAQWGQIK